MWDMTGVLWPHRMEIGMHGFALRVVRLWLGEGLIGGDACVGQC